MEKQVTETQYRITPIYMGSTLFQPLFFEFIRDHPHIHGEHWLALTAKTGPMGSPPYTWGAHGQLI